LSKGGPSRSVTVSSSKRESREQIGWAGGCNNTIGWAGGCKNTIGWACGAVGAGAAKIPVENTTAAAQ
jgi:hypothetical protein